MKTLLAVMAAMTATSFLAGCDDGTLDQSQFNSYDSLSDEYERIAAEQAGSAVASFSELPTTGGAVYEGVVNIIVQDGPAVTDVLFSAVGGMELDADFSDNTILGLARNFYVDDGSGGTPIEGGGRFQAGPITGTGPGGAAGFDLALFDFNLDGSALSGTLGGSLRDQAGPGQVPDGASGTIGGTVTTGPGTTFRGTWVTQYDPTEAPGEM